MALVKSLDFEFRKPQVPSPLNVLKYRLTGRKDQIDQLQVVKCGVSGDKIGNVEDMGSAKTETPTPVPKNTTKPYGRVILSTKNCLLPEEKLSVTPSQTDGLDREIETDLRIYGCELIQTAGILLKLPQVAMATGQVLLQRFYYSKSLVRHPIEHTAMACVCLASKIEEAPRDVRDVINVFNHIKQVNAKKGESSWNPTTLFKLSVPHAAEYKIFLFKSK